MEKLEGIKDEMLEDLINEGYTDNLRGADTLNARATTIYLAEKSQRNNLYIANISVQLSEHTLKISKRTFITAISALTIAITAMTFAVIDFFGDRTWKVEQLTVLEEIRDSVTIKQNKQ